MRLDPSVEPIILIVLVALLMVATIGGWTWCQKLLLRFKLHQRWARATAAEAEAPRLLTKLGYEVLGAQVQGTYDLEIDGQPVTVPLRADYLVSRTGLTFVAEVKSGKLAPKLTTASTRRQLLEYLVAFQVDGVLLVDGETRRIHEVVFPLAKRKRQGSLIHEGLALTAALVFVVVVFFLVWGR